MLKVQLAGARQALSEGVERGVAWRGWWTGRVNVTSFEAALRLLKTGAGQGIKRL